jgi:hypothetical protein
MERRMRRWDVEGRETERENLWEALWRVERRMRRALGVWREAGRRVRVVGGGEQVEVLELVVEVLF